MDKDEKIIAKQPEVNIITDPNLIKKETQKPFLTVTTGIGETYHVKIKQPGGRALLIAVHL